ncbi:hypothetical protein BDV95DRAFT_665130 [Massariosphaeria phaeospora]|uniref:Uncharacterized protein n=1 Tax=Massariosphaeria phaeospora TaxID=100035 RepID=A0A7C8IGC7_9PLEO|nr:hypothetical protein BDV95DRAFT_665130 [Massariosphaeria phaeospora]
MTLFYKQRILGTFTLLFTFLGTTHSFPTDDRGRQLWDAVKTKIQTHGQGEPTLTHQEVANNGNYILEAPQPINMATYKPRGIVWSPGDPWDKVTLRYWSDASERALVQANNGAEIQYHAPPNLENYTIWPNNGKIVLYLDPSTIIVAEEIRDQMPFAVSRYIWYIWLQVCRRTNRDPSVLNSLYHFHVTNKDTEAAVEEIVPDPAFPPALRPGAPRPEFMPGFTMRASDKREFYRLLGLPHIDTLVNVLIKARGLDDAHGLWKAPTSVEITSCDTFIHLPLGGLPR